MTQTIQRPPTILRRKQVELRTGLSRSTIYQYIKDGGSPSPYRLDRARSGGLNRR